MAEKTERKERKPELRFNGFDEEWEESKLGDICSVLSGTMGDSLLTNGKYCLTRIETISDGFVDENRVGYTNIKPDNIYKLNVGDILYSNINSISHIGKVAKYHGNSTLYHGINLLRLIPLNNVSSDFIVYLLCTECRRNWARTHANQAVNQASINQNLLVSQELMICDLDEQNKIGTSFIVLDALITHQQNKYDQLQNLKKAMLEKMFPRDGADVPEIRFKGFEGAWNRYKLGDIYQKIRNAFVGTATPYYVEEGHFYLESNNIKNGQINYNSKIYINDEFYEKQRDNWLHTGDLVMVQSGHVGHTAVIPEDLDNTSAHAVIIIANPICKTNPDFVNYLFQNHTSKKSIANITTGNTIKHILSSDMKKFEIILPDYGEQQKIAEYFQNLDNLIYHQQKMLEHLKHLKAALLGKMFVSEKAA